jgi:hypothetical protein
MSGSGFLWELGVTANRYVSFWGDEIVLKLIVVMAAQLYTDIKNH